MEQRRLKTGLCRWQSLRGLKAFVFFVWLSAPWALLAEELAPEYELERLLLLVEGQLEQANYSAAREGLDSAQALGLELPADFYFLEAQVLLEANAVKAARNALVRYANLAGRDGRHYQESLALISQLDRQAHQETGSAGADAAVVEASPSEAATFGPGLPAQQARQDYLARLKSLYLSSDSRKALIEHSNALLGANPYIGERLRQLDKRQGIHYRVSQSGQSNLVVQRSDFRRAGEADYQTERLDVFGVDPYLRWGCDYDRDQCWIWHPVRPSEKWIVLADNSQAAAEIAKALSYLLLLLQG